MSHLFFHTQNSPNEPRKSRNIHLPSELIKFIKKSLLPLGGFFAILTLAIISTHFITSQRNPAIPFVKQTSQAVLGAQASPLNLQGNIVFNIPGEFNQDVSFNKDILVQGNATLNGSLTVKGQSLNLGQGTITASNVLYGIKAGSGLNLTTGQNPTITNTGVTSLQGQTGSVTLTGGSGITINGTTISNTQATQNTFGTISDGTGSFTAGSNADTLTFAAGTGISLSLDTTNKKLTITNTSKGTSSTIDLATDVTGVLPVANGGTNLSSYTAGDLLYASGTTTLSKLGIGSSNTVLTSDGTSPAWSSVLTLTGLTINGNIIGNGTLSGLTGLTVSGIATASGITINGDTTLGANSSDTIAPLGLFSSSLLPSATTINLGSSNNQFGSVYAQSIYQNGTALSQYWQQNLGALSPLNATNDLLIGGASTSSAKLVLSGTTGNITATGALSGLTGLSVASGTVSFPASTIANTALANSSITINTGTGLSGGGTVALGGTLTLTNTQSGGVTSLSGTANQVITSGSTGAVTLSLPQSIATTSTPTFGGLTINGNTTLGSSAFDTVTPIASFAGSLVPSLSDQYNLGSSTNEWDNIYAKNLVVNSNQIANIYSDTIYLNKLWSTTATFNATGSAFSSGLQSPATNNQLSLNPAFPFVNWSYRKAVTIDNTGNSNTLTNYQVKITTDTAALITAGKMNADCSDLRFTNSDGSTLLNYWIESGCNTTSTIVWVKIPSITASSNYTIYEYYGNTSATSASSAANTFIDTDTGIQAAYRMDETSGSTVTDYSGNGNNGTATGTTIVTGKFGNARSFAGGSDNISTNYLQNSVTAYTIEAWVKTTANSGKIVQDRGSGSGQSITLGIGPVVGGSNGQAYIGLDSNGTFIGVYSSITINDGNWHHVVGTWGGTSGQAVTSSQFHIYIDGVNKDGATTTFGSGTAPLTGLSGTQIGNTLSGTLIDEVRIYNMALNSTQISNLYNNYGYVTTNSAGNEYVRAFSSPEPATSVGSESAFYYASGLQSWTSDTLDAGSGNTYLPNNLTVNYTLDGSDNIPPKFQIEGSSTGSFTGEQTIYPAGSGTYYQSGGTYPISSGTALDISSQVTNRFRYWKVIAYMDTGTTTTDTPTISSIQLQENNPLLLEQYGQFVGIGTANPTTTLDVNGGFHVSSHATVDGGFNVSSYATMSASLAVGYNSVPSGIGNAVFSGQVGIGTSTPGATSALDVLGGRVGIGTTNPLATLDLQSVLGTIPVASVSGKTSMASLIVDNSGIGDLFTASSSGLTRFVVTQNGNVGIGTTNPGTNLQVNGSSTVPSSQLGSLAVESGAMQLGLGVNTASNYSWIQSTQNAVAFKPLILNAEGGNVGIGTTNPSATLDVNGPINIEGTNASNYFSSGSSSTLCFNSGGVCANGSGTPSIVENYGLNLIGNGTTQPIKVVNAALLVGYTSSGTSYSSGNLLVSGTEGIGTTIPLQQSGIDVEKNGLGNAVAVFNQTGSGDILTASSSGSTKFTISNNGNTTINGTGIMNNLSDLGYATISASLAVGYNNNLSGVGNAIFSGQVGIGTSSPTQKLSIAGSESIYNAATGRGDIYTTTNLDKIWNTTALFNSTGTSFSSGMQNPAVGNQINLGTATSSFPLTNWTYRKTITVDNTGNSNTLNNYQVKVTTDTATLITAGEMNADCSDLRFTNSDGSTLLNYWIESGCNTTSTIVWVKIPSITASSNYTIYEYYGNTSATSVSSAPNTFIGDISNVSLAYREDENSGTTTTDYSGNNNTGTYTGTTVVAGQFNNARNFSSTNDEITLGTAVTLGTSWTVSAWINFPLPTDCCGYRSAFVQSGGTYHAMIWDGSGNLGTYNTVLSSSGYNTNALNGWHQITEVGNNGVSSFYVDGVVVGTASAQIQNQSVGTIGNFSGGGQQIGKLDEPRIYSTALTQAQITALAANYGYVTPNYAGHELVRKFSSPEPTASVGSETSFYASGLQSWTSDTIDAGSGNTYLPNNLTVSYTLDGSDNIPPKFQIEGSSTGSFTGEQTIYPAGSGTYYQSGGTYPISSGTQLDISPQITSRFRYWKVIAYMDTGTTATDTPTISSIELQDNKAAISMLASGNIGLGTTTPQAKLDVSDASSSTVAAFIRNINPGTGASGLAIQLGTSSAQTTNYFLSFLNGAGSIIGKIQGNGSGGVTYATSGIDFAEYYKKASNSGTLTPGTVVCETTGGISSCNNNGSILGVISNRAGFVGGTDHADDPTYALVGMVGQLPVTIATTGGEIREGDPLTVGINGEAIKATTAGQIVGHALGSSQDAQNGQIMVAVNPSWYDPSFYSLATSSVLGASTSALNEQLLTVQTATISGTLNVMGRTTLSDVGITGNISDGLVTIHGLDSSINTLAGDLNLQSEGLGGINILNGLVTIDTSGNLTAAGTITAQTLAAQTFVVKGTGSTGTASIPQGQTTLEIDTPVMNTTAKVFVTPNTLTTVPLIVSQKQYGKFFVKLAAPQSNPVTFDWLIIKNE